jgi:arsenate reductase (thioredoxin)
MTTHILILCTHNSARSVLGEGMINALAARLGCDVQGHSAGSAPSGRVNPMALQVLADAGIATVGFHSKSWDAFTVPNAPVMRMVITVCDSAAAEACPVWPGSPVQAHWGYPDPSNTAGGDAARRQAFELTRQAIGYRVLQMLQLPLASMPNADLQQALRRIANT